MKIMTYNETKPFFFVRGLRNFFISTSSQKKRKEGRMHVKATKNAFVCKILHVSAKVRITPKTKYPIIESVRSFKRIHQHLNYQDTEFEILLVVIKTPKHEINGLGGNLE